MLFGGRAVHWPESIRAWVIWLLLLIGLFLVWRFAAGRPVAVLATLGGFGGYAIEGQFSIPPAILMTGLVLILVARKRVRPIGARRVLMEGGLIGAGFLAYELGRFWSEGSAEIARRNASFIVDVEQRLGLAIEPSFQRYVVRYDLLTDLFNRTYSYLFVPFVLSVLFWTLVVDDSAYRLLRNSLGASAALAVALFALFPVAPPRLMPDLGIVDSHAIRGLSHGFVNDYAAMPSLHVGWTSLAGYALYRSLRVRYGRIVAAVAFLPALGIAITVIVTGNHYWVDGVIGALIAFTPVLTMAWHDRRRTLVSTRRLAVSVRAAWSASVVAMTTSAWVKVSVGSLGALLSYLIAGQVMDPGFTDYWGYMVAQIAATIAAIIWLSHKFAAAGGLSWITHLIVIAVTYLDTFGTAAHLYDRFVSYDKIAHFGGAAALSAAAYDILFALNCRRAIAWTTAQRAFIAMSIATVLGGCWEIYEFSADLLFHTYRHAGQLDTMYDLISDATGAAVTSLLLFKREISVSAPATRPDHSPALALQAEDQFPTSEGQTSAS